MGREVDNDDILWIVLGQRNDYPKMVVNVSRPQQKGVANFHQKSPTKNPVKHDRFRGVSRNIINVMSIYRLQDFVKWNVDNLFFSRWLVRDELGELMGVFSNSPFIALFKLPRD